MGGYLKQSEGSNSTYSDYNWIRRDCRETFVRAVCRLDCDDLGPIVTSEEPTTFFETTESSLAVTQRLMYTFYTGSSTSGKGIIYDYVVDESDGPLFNGQYDIPFAARQPSLAYNKDLFVLEVVGDYWETTNSNHYQMDNNGQFNQYLSSLYEADKYSTIVYSPNVGTICIAGTSKKQSVYIITQKSDWPTILTASTKYLSDIQGSRSSDFGVTTHENIVFLVGGYISNCEFQRRHQLRGSTS